MDIAYQQAVCQAGGSAGVKYVKKHHLTEKCFFAVAIFVKFRTVRQKVRWNFLAGGIRNG